MKTPSLLLAALLSSSLGACIVVDGDSTLTIDNQSSYAIHEVYLAEISEPNWGPELLRSSVLYPGELLEIRNVNCGTYDALVYDELGASCELSNIDLCFDDARWVIDNALLSTCTIFR